MSSLFGRVAVLLGFLALAVIGRTLAQDAPKDKPPAELTTAELDALWEDLANANGPKGWQTRNLLIAHPKQSVPLLKERLKPAKGIAAERVDKLIADLDSNDFATRQKATEELGQLGELVEPALRKAVDARPSLEMRQRLDQLLSKADGAIPSGEKLRTIRGIEVLEHVGTPEAAEVLKGLAGGVPDATATQDARRSLARLMRRTSVRVP